MLTAFTSWLWAEKGSVQFSDTISRRNSFSFNFPGQIPSAWRPFGHGVLGLVLPLEELLVSLAGVGTDLQAGLPWRINIINRFLHTGSKFWALKFFIINRSQSFADHATTFIIWNILLESKWGCSLRVDRETRKKNWRGCFLLTGVLSLCCPAARHMFNPFMAQLCSPVWEPGSECATRVLSAGSLDFCRDLCLKCFWNVAASFPTLTILWFYSMILWPGSSPCERCSLQTCCSLLASVDERRKRRLLNTTELSANWIILQITRLTTV